MMQIPIRELIHVSPSAKIEVLVWKYIFLLCVKKKKKVYHDKLCKMKQQYIMINSIITYIRVLESMCERMRTGGNVV